MMKIISKKEAKEKGLKRYYTGEPCVYGHISERYTNGGGCIVCLDENRKKRMKEIYSDPDKHKLFRQKENAKRIRLMSNSEYRDRQNRLRRKLYWENPKIREKLINSMKAWEQKNGHKRYEVKKKWQELNKEKVRESGRKWRKLNPGKSSMYTKIYHYKRRGAMPEWANKKHIQDMYDAVAILNESCGRTKPGNTAFHVDHIIPLRHEDVCGLHVHNNLQIVPAEYNLKKGNKF